MANLGRWAVPILLPFIAALTLVPSLHGQDEPRGALYLGLGDSLTEGVGARRAGGGFMDRFFDYLRGKATGERLILVNRGVSGESSESFLWGGQLEEAVAMIGDPELETRTVVLSLGGNDMLGLLRTRPCTSDPDSDECRDAVAANLARFAANYTQILGRLRSALDAQPGQKTLFVVTPYNPLSGTGNRYEGPADRALLGADLTADCAASTVNLANVGLNDVIACIGAGAGALVVDAYEPFRGRAIQLTNIIFGDHHPNDAGHAVMGDALISAFEADLAGASAQTPAARVAPRR